MQEKKKIVNTSLLYNSNLIIWLNLPHLICKTPVLPSLISIQIAQKYLSGHTGKVEASGRLVFHRL